MRHLMFTYLDLVLCILILIARLGDLISTYLVTPTLKLESNLLAKKLGWRFGLLTLLVCLTPFYSPALGFIILIPSLLVTASNVRGIWLARRLGETQLWDFYLSAAKDQKLMPALTYNAVSSFFIFFSGLVLLFLYPDPEEDWGFWYAVGIMTYGFAMLVHGTAFYWRLFSKAKSQARPEETNPS